MLVVRELLMTIDIPSDRFVSSRWHDLTVLVCMVLSGAINIVSEPIVSFLHAVNYAAFRCMCYIDSKVPHWFHPDTKISISIMISYGYIDK